MRLYKRHGDTLIEAVVALGILTLLLATATTSAIRSYRTADASRERTIAFNLAQSQADGLRAYRLSQSWADFSGYNPVEQDRITSHVYHWSDKRTAYPAPAGASFSAGRNPNVRLIIPGVNTSDPSGNSSSQNLYSAVNTNAGSSGLFYMCTSYDLSIGCTSNTNKIPSGWYISAKQAEKVSLVNNDYYLTIVGNRANIDVANTDVCKITDDVMRFDIRVKWLSRLSQTVQTSSLVVYLANTDTAQLKNATC